MANKANGSFGIEVYNDGLTQLVRDYLKFRGDLDEITDDMLMAKSGKIRQGIAFAAERDLRGPYFEGEVALGTKIKNKKPVKSRKGKYVIIHWTGKQHGNRLGEIAFVNEFGKKSQPARPFIRDGIKEMQEAAHAAAREVLHAGIKRHNL